MIFGAEISSLSNSQLGTLVQKLELFPNKPIRNLSAHAPNSRKGKINKAIALTRVNACVVCAALKEDFPYFRPVVLSPLTHRKSFT